jgi:hypothetical protein
MNHRARYLMNSDVQILTYLRCPLAVWLLNALTSAPCAISSSTNLSLYSLRHKVLALASCSGLRPFFAIALTSAPFSRKIPHEKVIVTSFDECMYSM